ncbi:MAG TPA: hypothetical protein VFZ68_17985, partial [Acidimicrobiales bacterium]
MALLAWGSCWSRSAKGALPERLESRPSRFRSRSAKRALPEPLQPRRSLRVAAAVLALALVGGACAG